MGILGIGIDIVSLQRIVDVAQRRSARKLAQRVLSPIEFSELHSRKVATGSSFDSSRFLAVRCVVVFFATYVSYFTLSDGLSRKLRTKRCSQHIDLPGRSYLTPVVTYLKSLR